MNPVSSALRKLTTKPVWYWERNRPYFLKQKLNQLPVLQSASHSAHKINILCTPNAFTEALFSAWSWCKHLGHMYRIRIIVDGQLPMGIKNKLTSIIHGMEVETVDDLISPSLSSFQSLHSFGLHHPLGRKLLLLLSLQQYEEFIYSDNDVLVFNPPSELLDSLASRRPAFNQESSGSAYDPQLLNFAAQNNILPALRFNSGLIYFPKNVVNLDFFDHLASIKDPANYTWFDEQTMLALAFGAVAAKGLSAQDYVVNTCRQFWWDDDVNYRSICTRHFTGPVRHLMYSRGYPQLLKNSNAL